MHGKYVYEKINKKMKTGLPYKKEQEKLRKQNVIWIGNGRTNAI